MKSTTIFWMVPVVGFILFAIIALFRISNRTKSQPLNRRDYSKRIKEIDSTFQKSPSDKKIRLEYAKNLFKVGDFSKSQEILKPLLKDERPPAEATYLSAHIEYLNGHYYQAEKMFESISKKSTAKIHMNAQIGLVGTYYQTNQYGKAYHLFKGLEGKIQLALWDLMRSFGDEKPYQIDWKSNNRIIVPFIITDPLPVISVAINGELINVIIDTGGELFYLDETVASSLGIKAVARQAEPYAGGKTVEVGYGRADSLTIGDVTLTSVPIKLGPVQRISLVDNLRISGILTTGVLQQFLATIDYPGNQLILRKRKEESGRKLMEEFSPVELPFVLAMTHLMICQGSINDSDTLNLFVDSGLADSRAALCLPIQTLDYLRIPVPATEIVPENSGGLGGGGFPVGRFPIENITLGTLRQDNKQGLFGIFPPQLYFGCEFMIDGLLSHQFLKNYKWTIDFDAMKMIFSQ